MDDQEIRNRLQPYLSAQMGEPVVIDGLRRPVGNGFSADTLILELDHGPHVVVQAAPRGPALFEDYDLQRAFRVQRELAAHGVPVPAMRWLCEDPEWLGAPFYVMGYVPGRVPPDRPPYHVEGWLVESSRDDRRAIWMAGIDALAMLHRVSVDSFGFLSEDGQHDPARQRIERWRVFGQELGHDTEPALLAALDDLGARSPRPGELRVHWGDAKLGNMIFVGAETAAILDWELCGLSMAEEDLAHWMAVDWFLSTGLGHPRLSGLPTAEETVERYESQVARSTADVAWWFAFAVVRMGLIFQRAAVQSRRRRGGDGPLRANVIVPHLDDLLAGQTWAEYG